MLRRPGAVPMAALAGVVVMAGCTFSVSSKPLTEGSAAAVDPSRVVLVESGEAPPADSVAVARITVRSASNPDVEKIREKVRSEAARYGADRVYRISRVDTPRTEVAVEGTLVKRQFSGPEAGEVGNQTPETTMYMEGRSGATDLVYVAVKVRT